MENTIVRLEEMATEHVDGIWEVANYPEIWTYLSVTLNSLSRVKAYVNEVKADEKAFVIIDQATNKIVGSTRFMDIKEGHRTAEIGATWLTPAAWRTSINTNTKLVLLHYAFEVWGLQRVTIKTDAENIRSRTAIERIGGTFEGILRNHMIRKDGTSRDTAMYSIIATEWPEIKRKLGEQYEKNV